jgi:glucan phosphoethanolaminetransferase (alkaline phosphatase superfamily)
VDVLLLLKGEKDELEEEFKELLSLLLLLLLLLRVLILLLLLLFLRLPREYSLSLCWIRLGSIFFIPPSLLILAINLLKNKQLFVRIFI